MTASHPRMTTCYPTQEDASAAFREFSGPAAMLKCRFCGLFVIRYLSGSPFAPRGYHTCGNGIRGVLEQIAVNFAALENPE